jgi:metal-sulfur cluster biosynthetic enzyme
MKRIIKIKASPKQKALNVLKEVSDPEVGANIVDLGLIYDVKADEKSVSVLMTLTSLGCPLGNYLIAEVKNKLKEAGFKNVNVNITFDPPWTPKRMNKELRKKLGI